MNQLRKTFLLLKELGLSSTIPYALYHSQRKSGHLLRRSPIGGVIQAPDFSMFSPKKKNGLVLDWNAVSESGEIPAFIDHPADLLRGRFRPFGGDLALIDWSIPGQPLQHWTKYGNEIAGTDIKLIWEPARFNWCLCLGQAWQSTREEIYPEFFWTNFEEFTRQNPVNLGPNWASAQELSLRLISWTLILGNIWDAQATTAERTSALLKSIWQHASRIPLTLNYARSQRNNHLLSEALGLILAGDILQDFDPAASKWSALGEKEFEHGIMDQVAEDGTYAQHSANYHRLMLQLALLYLARMRKIGKPVPTSLSQRLASATRWMLAQLDPLSGQLPNLGHNDGALILPIGCTDFRDYRPTAQASSLVFLGRPCLPQGRWDTLAASLGMATKGDYEPELTTSPAVYKVGNHTTWGILRAVRFTGRPAHADQLHVDLWWNGANIARDAGTYLYNGADPWTNALDRTRVHNTVTINHRDQMERISRFLWLDNACAKVTLQSENYCAASHDGYRELGVIHTRSLEFLSNNAFRVTDHIHVDRVKNEHYLFSLHWLLPDWKWQLVNGQLVLTSEKQKILITVSGRLSSKASPIEPCDISLIRGGENLMGNARDPILGWESNTYAQKKPVLSFLIEFESTNSLDILTEWTLSDD